jgi:precorrin-3B synthase
VISEGVSVSPALDACPGVLALHPARDGLVARIRLPGGYATAPAWLALAALARDFGDGRVDLTARGNVQLRGLREADATALAAAAAAAGLLPSAEHDRARNITASPLAGLPGPLAGLAARPPLRPLVDALDAALLAAPEFAALPGRFLFALNDGTAGAILATCDLGLRHAPVAPAPLNLTPGSPVPAALGAGDAVAVSPVSGDFDLIVAGRYTGVRVPAAEAVSVVVTALRAALASGVGEDVTRIAGLPDDGQSVAAAVGGTLGAKVPPDVRLPLGPAVPVLVAAAAAASTSASSAAPTASDVHDPYRFTAASCGKTVGIMRDTPDAAPDRGMSGAGGAAALVVAARLGRLTVSQIEVITSMLAPGEVVRIGIAGRLVIPLAAGLTLEQAAGRLADAGLIVDPGDPMGDVTACSGAACGRSLADVRAAAGPVPDHRKTHWAGCSRLCGRPPDAVPVVALDAVRYRMPGEEVA